MNFLVLSLLLWIWNWRSLNEISMRNLALKDAGIAYNSGNYRLAAQKYGFLVSSSKHNDPLARLNLGHAFFHLKQYRQAREQYELAVQSLPEQQSTSAITQLGVIACIERDSVKALRLFRQSLLSDPLDEVARFNYELIEHLIKESQSPSSPNKPAQTEQKPKNQPKPPNQEQEVVRSDQQKDVLRQLRSLNITEEQAMQLLNAMRDDDLPYELARRRQKSGKQSTGKQRW